MDSQAAAGESSRDPWMARARRRPPPCNSTQTHEFATTEMGSTCRMPPPDAIIEFLGGPPRIVDGQRLDPLIQFMVRYFADPRARWIRWRETRSGFDLQGNWLTHPPEPGVRLQSWTVRGPAGPVPLRDLPAGRPPAGMRPRCCSSTAGGHAAGSLVSHRDVCRQLAHEGQCAVVAVDYRLAPSTASRGHPRRLPGSVRRRRGAVPRAGIRSAPHRHRRRQRGRQHHGRGGPAAPQRTLPAARADAVGAVAGHEPAVALLRAFRRGLLPREGQDGVVHGPVPAPSEDALDPMALSAAGRMCAASARPCC